MPNITKVERIEKRVRREYPLDYYENQFRQLVHLEWGNEWLKTQEAIDILGAEVCQQKLDMNAKKVESIKKELEFVRKRLYS